MRISRGFTRKPEFFTSSDVWKAGAVTVIDRDYVELMAHFDAEMPGRIHRVIYEDLVADTESQVRRLLAYCGLPFEAQCLRFFENERPVRTASSEQVRQPIYREGVDHWRHYEPWLAPLKAALGPVLESYPHPPPPAAGDT